MGVISEKSGKGKDWILNGKLRLKWLESRWETGNEMFGKYMGNGDWNGWKVDGKQGLKWLESRRGIGIEMVGKKWEKGIEMVGN